MSRHTPLVVDGCLHQPTIPDPVVLDTPAWQAWLAAAEHESFHFRDPAGEFTARKERKQRGTSYWVAYRQAHNRLYKRYLGKAEALTEAHLIEVAAALTQLCTAPAAQLNACKPCLRGGNKVFQGGQALPETLQTAPSAGKYLDP